MKYAFGWSLDGGHIYTQPVHLSSNISDNAGGEKRIKVRFKKRVQRTIGRHEYLLWIVHRVSCCDAIHSIHQRGKIFIFVRTAHSMWIRCGVGHKRSERMFGLHANNQ